MASWLNDNLSDSLDRFAFRGNACDSFDLIKYFLSRLTEGLMLL